MPRRSNGEGSLRLRADGRWEGRYSITVDGQPVRRSVFAPTREEGIRRLREQLTRSDHGLPAIPARLTVAQFLADWVDGVAATVRPRTRREYAQVVRTHLVPRLGRIPMARLQPEHVQRLHADLLAMGRSPKTVRNVHGVLHRALEQAVRWRRLSVNVAGLVDPPRAPLREMAALDAPAIRQLLTAAATDDLEAAWVLAVTTGMRQGELLALSWPDVDLDAGQARVVASMIRRTGLSALRVEPKTERSRRVIDLPAIAVDALRRHRQAARVLDPRGAVFTAPNGGELTQSVLAKRWRRFRDRAGLPPVRFHDLRHSAASLMLSQGISVRTVADAMGHDPAITLRVYAHVTPAMRRETAQVMDDLFGG